MNVAAQPDLSVLAGYVRNRLKAGQVAIFRLHGAEVFITATGDGRLLVASEKGESVVLEATDRNNAFTFQRGGFRLQRAATLSRLIDVLRDKSDRAKSAEQDRKKDGTNG